MQHWSEALPLPEKPGTLCVWWLGQAGFVLKLAGKTLYIDPFFSDFPGRITPPPFPPEEAVTADYVLGTHDHVDHIDRQAWPRLAQASPGAKFLVPVGCEAAVRREVGVPGQRLATVSEERPYVEGPLEIFAVPAAHETLERDEESGGYTALGYVIRGGGFTVYHAGDCCVYEGLRAALRAFGRLDLMLLPINGRSGSKLRSGIIGNMTYQEAVDLAGDLEPRLVLPMHFDAFSGNTADAALFLDYLQVKYPRVAGRIPRIGEKLTLEQEG